MIKIENLNFKYKNSEEYSINNLNLDITENSIFGLLGPNGAGKTTLLSIINGLIVPPPNTVFVNGNDLYKTSRETRKLISIVPQEYAFYDRLSVEENLNFFAASLGIEKSIIKNEINRVIQETGLEKYTDKKSDILSGGLKRRLNLAIGLLGNPNILLLDEPTVGIDPHSRFFILDTIKKIRARGTSIIYTSHYMEEVEAICDEIAIIDKGRLIIKAPTDELLLATRGDRLSVNFTKPYQGNVNHLLIKVSELSSSPPKMSEDQQSLQVNIRDDNQVYTLFELLKCHDISISRIDYGAKNLEEVFLNLTQYQLRD